MDSLMRATARLAKNNPALRDFLVPILKKYAEDPKTTDIYPHKMDHGWTEPLAGGSDIMRRVQNQFRHEQGLPTRPDSEVVPKVAGDTRLPVSTDIRHPYYYMTDYMGSLEDALKGDPNVSKDRKVMRAFADLRKADIALYKALGAKYLWD